MTLRQEKLYRYCRICDGSAEFVERTLCHDELYFSAPSSFNDPFDCRPIFSFDASKSEMASYFEVVIKKYQPHLEGESLRCEVNRRVDEYQCNTNAIIEIQDYYAELVTNKIGVLCLSSVNDDILMWSHYADSHRGICLEFDIGFEFFAKAQKVIYPHDRPKINPFRQSQDEMLEIALLSKSSHWKYENEWRIIQYIHGPGIYKFPTQSLTGIILGSQILLRDRLKILRWVGERDSDIRLYQSSTSNEKFTLKIDEFEEK